MASGEATVVVRIEERPGGRVAWVTLDHRAKLIRRTIKIGTPLLSRLLELPNRLGASNGGSQAGMN